MKNPKQEDAGAVVPPKQGKQCNNGDQAAKNIDPVIKGDRRQAAEQDRQQDNFPELRVY